MIIQINIEEVLEEFGRDLNTTINYLSYLHFEQQNKKKIVMMQFYAKQYKGYIFITAENLQNNINIQSYHSCEMPIKLTKYDQIPKKNGDLDNKCY